MRVNRRNNHSSLSSFDSMLIILYASGKVKVKFAAEQAMKTQRGSRDNLGARWGRVINATPRPLDPRERDPVSLMGGPQGRSGRVRKILLLPRFDSWTVHPVASRYTEWAILVHMIQVKIVPIPH
jgi:hypothetical protein